MTRLLDITLSLTALLLLLPVLLPVVLMLALTGEGEIFYAQRRVGLNEEEFNLLKFATMLKNSPNIGAGSITVKNDPRVLPFGVVLRKTKINELPQLINVLVGEMSLIGPRPMTRINYEMYPEAAKRALSTVRPGLSGIGSIIFRDEEELLADREDPRGYYRDTIAPYKAAVESWYVDNKGMEIYWGCIFLTIWVVIKPSSTLVTRFFHGLPRPDGDLREDLEVLRQRRA